MQDGWRYSRHTLRLRKRILRERRIGKLRFAREQDPVQIFAEYHRGHGKRGRKHGTLDLQLGSAAAGTPVPDARADAPRDAAPRAAVRTRPSPPIDLSDLKIQNN